MPEEEELNMKFAELVVRNEKPLHFLSIVRAAAAACYGSGPFVEIAAARKLLREGDPRIPYYAKTESGGHEAFR